MQFSSKFYKTIRQYTLRPKGIYGVSGLIRSGPKIYFKQQPGWDDSCSNDLENSLAETGSP
jgi:hypothetical protein